MARVVVAGYMVRFPLAGNLLAYFHYVLGLARLGHEVAYVEESGWPSSCYDPRSGEWSEDPSPGLCAVRELVARTRVDVPVAYVERESGHVHGAARHELETLIGEADLVLNVGGVCWLPQFRLAGRRALVDMDPLFTQVGGFGAEALAEHDVHFTYGGNVGKPGCAVPDAGVEWTQLPPPVVRDLWPPSASRVGAFTTVANWSAYGPVTHDGERYGQKDEEFGRVVSLPSHTSERLELALSGADDDTVAELRAAGWSVRDGGEVSREVDDYVDYVRRSRGELSVAKHAYVKTRSGWFSDRSVCYLASGRPVVLQDTGFSDWLPVGDGVLAFSSLDEAAACLHDVGARYDEHREAAASVAATTFAHDVVLPALLEAAGV